ncbi:MAG TPA: glutamine--fructose-6-phosphate transaminase (isomerizing) [Nitrospirota bacterium]|nr:glutamine--fructose-6-phosphate transaminase (isomerizing) [Nitrospirota bacterium]
MCGIVGFVGSQGSVNILIEGLKRLEYRGYDSAGVAYQNGHGLEIYKTKGKIHDLQQILPDRTPQIHVGLGHTRWATHGEPSTINAHPHSLDGVSVVHNGIIENYRQLRAELEAEGYHFESQTDTEVVPQLIVKYLRTGLSIEEAIRKTVSQLRGSFALGILHDQTPDTLIAVRRGSPLVIGIGPDSHYIASDIPALLGNADRFLYLDDDRMAVLRPDSLVVKNLVSLEREPYEHRIVSTSWSPAMAEKQGYEHFMLKEIHEQPQGVKDTLREWIDDPQRLLEELHIAETVNSIRRIHIAACGTSYHAGLVGRYLIEKFARIPVVVDIASEFRYMSPVVPKGTLFVTITQSGETADTLAAQREAREKGALACTICNVVGSTSTREAEAVMYTRCGPEIGVASTKAFTAQLAALCMLGMALGERKNKLHKVESDTLKQFLLGLPDIIEEALTSDLAVKSVAQSLADRRTILYLGRGVNYPVALEGALKMKELSYLFAEGYPAGEMKHGPIALIEKGVPVVLLAPVDELYEKILSNMEEVKARGGRAIVITDSPAAFHGRADDIITVPSTHPALQPFVSVIPLQFLAYHVAVMKGCNVDQPRNLAKSVTVE